MRIYYEVLRHNPQFARLWGAQVISLTGDWFNTVVLSALVAEYSNGSGLAISIFLMARFLPPLLVSPLAGVLVDRFNRRHLLIWSNLLRAFIVPLFLLATSPDQLWLIYAVTIAQFTLSAIFEPGQSAIIPSLVRYDDLVEANTLVSVTWSVMLALGAVLGGVFAFVFGVAAALIADALTFILAAGLIATISYQPLTQDAKAKNDQDLEPEDTSFREGLRYVRRTPQVASGIFVKFGQSIGNVDTLITIFATQLFLIGNNGEVSLGILYGVFGFGAFIGPILTNRINDGSVSRMRRLIGIGFLAIVVGWFALGSAPTFLFVCLAIFIRAVGGSINWTYSTIILQKTAPDTKLGRVFSLDMAGFQLATVVSTLAHGALIDLVGASQVHIIAFGTGIVSLLPLGIWIVWTQLLEQSERQALAVSLGD